jgi:DNA-binding protein HU-beta
MGLRGPIKTKTTEEGKAMAVTRKALTKGQLVSHFANKFDLTKKVAGEIVDEMAVVAVTETKKKGAFVLPGIGKTALVRRKARMGRNPATGEPIKIPAKTVIKIRPAKAFKDAILG